MNSHPEESKLARDEEDFVRDLAEARAAVRGGRMDALAYLLEEDVESVIRVATARPQLGSS